MHARRTVYAVAAAVVIGFGMLVWDRVSLARQTGPTVRPLPRAVLGGLTVSTRLTLLFIPTLYTILEERVHRQIAVEKE